MRNTRVAKVARKPRPFADDWPVLFSFRDCLPRSEFPFVLRRITGNLYRFADQGYVHLGRRSYVHDGHAATCLRIFQLFWARNDDAAIVVASLHRKIGRGGVSHWQKINRRKLETGNAIPPDELLGCRLDKRRHLPGGSQAQESDPGVCIVRRLGAISP
jgi:hypothetical protein